MSLLENKFEVDSIHYLNPKDSLSITLNQTKLCGIMWFPLLLDQHLDIDSLIINSFSVAKPYLPSLILADSLNRPKLVNPPEIKEVNISYIGILNGAVSFDSYSSVELADNRLYGVSLEVHDLNWRTDSIDPFPRWKDLDLNLDSAIHYREHLSIQSGPIQLHNEELVCNGFILKTQKDYEFRHRKTALELELEQLTLNLRLDSLLRSKALYVPHAHLKGATIKAHMDKRKPNKEALKSGLNHVLSNLRFPLLVEQIRLEKSNIQYSEQVLSGERKGTLFLSDVSALIKNLTNNSQFLSVNPIMEAKLESMLMGEGKMQVQIRYDLSSKNDEHWVKGSLGSMPLKALNPVMLPLVFVDFKRGQVNQMNFSFHGTDQQAKGKLDFYYQHLRINIHSKHHLNQDNILSILESGLINALFLRKNNPHNGHFKPAEINYARDPNRSIFNFWWKSIFSGISHTIVKGG
jgi:hypothetical protein